MANASGRLFAELIQLFVLRVDHASYARFDGHPFGTWDVWLNVSNVEADHGASERDLFVRFYSAGPGWDTDGWRVIGAFFTCVLRPMEWAGFLTGTEETNGGKIISRVFKSPVWRSALKLDTDDLLGRFEVAQRVH